MRLCPKTNQPHQDIVYTPASLCKKIVEHYQPQGLILEPCKGDGAFLEFLPGADWCEIQEGVDFFDYKKSPDWIVTNPPWSKIRQFIDHAIKIDTKNIVFLININALTTRSRINLIYNNGYGVKEFMCLDNPKEGNWPQTGFQLAAIHIQKGYTGGTIWSRPDYETML